MGKVAKKYTEQDVLRCLTDIKNKVPFKTACRKHNIPRSTIKFRLSSKWTGKTRKGPPTALTEAEEHEIVSWIGRMARKGFPITKFRLVLAVKSFLAENPREGQMNAGYKWYRAFLRRHPEISVRKPEKVTRAGATVEPDDIRRWHRSVREILEEEGHGDILLDPTRLMNGDEFGLQLDPDTKAVLVPKSTKNAYQIDNGSKKNITVMNTYTAAGLAVPPCVILPYQRIPAEVSRTFPASWGIGKSESGWMTKDAFLGYIKNVLHPFLKEHHIQLPVIYFVDGHKSHTPFETSQECVELGIILVCLYANCTHIIQPADVAIYRGLKAGWTKQVRIWQAKNDNTVLRITDFAGVLKKALDASFKPEFVKNGFRICGLYPFDEQAIDYSKCIAGSNNQKSSDEKVTQPADTAKTIPVSCDLLNGIIDRINPSQAALYRAVEPDFFENESEKIVCELYKNVLQSLDSRCLDDFSEDDGRYLKDKDNDMANEDDSFMKEEFLDEFFNESSEHDALLQNDDYKEDSYEVNGRKMDGDAREMGGYEEDDYEDEGGPERKSREDVCEDYSRSYDEGSNEGDKCDDGFDGDAGDYEGENSEDEKEVYEVNDIEAKDNDLDIENVEPEAYPADEDSYGEVESIEKSDPSFNHSIRSFLEEPTTPKKNKSRKYKKPKSPPVLTSRRRMELHRKIEQEKEERKKQKEQNRLEKARIAEEKRLKMIEKAQQRLERLQKGLKEQNANAKT